MIRVILPSKGDLMKIYNVSEITKHIKLLLESDYALSNVYIRGEISNYKQHYSGHCYFTLKDANASIRSVMFRSRAQFLKFQPHDGLKVLAGGNVTVFERDGQYQLYVDQLLPEGAGELSLAYEQLKAKLEAEGLFSSEKKKRLPFLPKQVGIITSPTGAAIRDIIKVAKRRHPGVNLLLYPVQVQGEGAGEQIARAITFLNKNSRVDVIIVGRGGGSIEELWAFNEEVVVRAIADSRIPIVSAVGHETDYTLSDFAADYRAATPSQGAEIVVPNVKELERYLVTLTRVLTTNMINVLSNKKMQLNQCMKSQIFVNPRGLLLAREQLLDSYIQKLHQALQGYIQKKQHNFTLLTEKLNILNPLAVLERGFSLTRLPNGTNIVSSQQVSVGDELEIILGKGILDVQVKQVRRTLGGQEKNTK